MKTKVISAHGWFNAEKDDVILYDKWQAYLNYPHKDDSHADDDLWELVNGSIKFNEDLHERVLLEGEKDE